MKNMKRLYRCNRKQCSAEECEASPCVLTTDIAFAADPEDYIEIPNGAISSAEDWAKLDEYNEKIRKEDAIWHLLSQDQ